MNCELQYVVMFTLLRHQYVTVAHTLTQALNFVSKSEFKSKCCVRGGFRLKLRSVYDNGLMK